MPLQRQILPGQNLDRDRASRKGRKTEEKSGTEEKSVSKSPKERKETRKTERGQAEATKGEKTAFRLIKMKNL